MPGAAQVKGYCTFAIVGLPGTAQGKGYGTFATQIGLNMAINTIKHEENAWDAPKGAGKVQKTRVKRIFLRFNAYVCDSCVFLRVFCRLSDRGSSEGGLGGGKPPPTTGSKTNIDHKGRRI